MLLRLNKKAQSTAEYVIVLGLIVGAVIAMQSYVKKGFQGKIRQVVDANLTDSINGTDLAGIKAEQFEPTYLQSDFNNTRNSTETSALKDDLAVDRNLTNEDSNRIGNQVIKASEDDAHQNYQLGK